MMGGDSGDGGYDGDGADYDRDGGSGVRHCARVALHVDCCVQLSRALVMHLLNIYPLVRISSVPISAQIVADYCYFCGPNMLK